MMRVNVWVGWHLGWILGGWELPVLDVPLPNGDDSVPCGGELHGENLGYERVGAAAFADRVRQY